VPLLPHPHPDSWASAIEQTTPLPGITSPGWPRMTHRAAVHSTAAWCGFGLVPLLTPALSQWTASVPSLGNCNAAQRPRAVRLSGRVGLHGPPGPRRCPGTPRPISVGSKPCGINPYLGDEGVGWLLFPLALVAATASYISRFRHSTGIERVQLNGLPSPLKSAVHPARRRLPRIKSGSNPPARGRRVPRLVLLRQLRARESGAIIHFPAGARGSFGIIEIAPSLSRIANFI
jgi:hypothetical protein